MAGIAEGLPRLEAEFERLKGELTKFNAQS